MKLADLPKFRADRIELVGKETLVYGRFNVFPVIQGERSWLLDETVAYCGDLLDVHVDSRTAVFKCWEDDLVAEVFDPGLAWMYGNFNASDVWIVLREFAVWSEFEFRASDAIARIENGWRALRPVTSADKQPTDYLIPGGWDHEHCFICTDQINEEQPWCFRSVYGEGTYWWACPSCYQRWIVSHDISFLFAAHN